MILENRLIKCVIPLLTSCLFLFPHSISAAQKADLRVTKIEIIPGNPQANGPEAKIRMTVKNVGDLTPSKRSSLNGGIWSVDQSGNRRSGTNVPMLFSSYSMNIPRLAPSQHIQLTGKHTFQHTGRHRVEAWINTEGFAVGEEEASNNFSQRNFSVKASLADLVVCFKKNNKVPAHRKSTFPVKVRNIGQAPSKPCDLRFWIKKKGVKHYKIPALLPGEEYGIQRSVYIASKSIKRFSLNIDSKQEVREMNENNNIIQGTICTEKYCPVPENSQTKCSNLMD